MILSMKQGQQQKQKLTQEQSFFLDILKFNKEELTDYLEKEYQENPLIDFDRRIFNKEGVSFEEDLSDIENNWYKSIEDREKATSPVPNGFFCYCYTDEIKLNILTFEYTKQICYNAITSKKHSLFTMILYREIRLSKLLTADKNKAAEVLGAYQVKKQGEYTLEDYYALPDDQRYELIDGVLYDMAAPAVTHQEIAFEIAVALRNTGLRM